MKAVLTLHKSVPPFGAIGEIRTATDIDRLRSLDVPGSMYFRCSSQEASQTFREGDTLVDHSTEGIAPWLWFISRVADSLVDGMVDVEVQEWRQQLYRRTVPGSFTAASLAAGEVARDLLQAVNSRHPTHIRVSDDFTPITRVVLPSTPLPLGGLSLGAALDQIALITDSEWWVEYLVSWQGVEAALRWSHRRGLDKTGEVVLEEGHHLASSIYSRDITDSARTVQVIGSGDSPSNVPRGGVVVGAHISVERQPQGGRFEEAGELERRLSLTGPAAASIGDRLDVSPSEGSPDSLVTSSRSLIRLPFVPLQSLEVEVRSLPDIVLAGQQPIKFWSSFDVGDIITVKLSSAVFGRGATVRARVMAEQPDEGSGVMPLVVELEQGVVAFLRGLE